jgi:NNMT/PNMT/TEMT family
MSNVAAGFTYSSFSLEAAPDPGSGGSGSDSGPDSTSGPDPGSSPGLGSTPGPSSGSGLGSGSGPSPGSGGGPARDSDLGLRALTVADYSEWQPRDYFDTYYGGEVLPDEERVLSYELCLLESQPLKFGRALEYGCGPTLHRAIAAAQYVFRIDMADRVAGNLAQIRAWLKAGPQNTDWNAFTRYILYRETGSSPDARRIERREELTRNVIRNLYSSDARWEHPLGAERQGFYDLIVSGFCIDAVSRDKHVWRECMRNVLSMLSDGGLLVLHALYRCNAYRVGERLFPSADLSKDDVLESLVENGFVRGSIDVEVAPCPENAHHGYSGILMASGRKAWHRRRSASQPRRHSGA